MGKSHFRGFEATSPAGKDFVHRAKTGVAATAKTTMMVRRETFPGFAKASNNAFIASDRELSREMAGRGRRIGFAAGVLVVHN